MNIRITCSELEIETIRDCLKALDGLDDNLYVKPGEDKIVSRDPVFQQVMSRSYSGDRYTVEGNIHQDIVLSIGMSAKRIAPVIISLVQLAKSLKVMVKDEIGTLEALAKTIRAEEAKDGD